MRRRAGWRQANSSIGWRRGVTGRRCGVCRRAITHALRR
ncbi:hypothetical protein BSIN_3634 [Burkholderia singularis]|uniref:Uncharacterized protein n=1 Tax=Burkholderia singularis TaxID=1503053 RepID=A0A238H5J7_9BURK|nr:hypothetical protein BSIN_3634 [Burkholderia singularis]